MAWAGILQTTSLYTQSLLVLGRNEFHPLLGLQRYGQCVIQGGDRIPEVLGTPEEGCRGRKSRTGSPPDATWPGGAATVMWGPAPTLTRHQGATETQIWQSYTR